MQCSSILIRRSAFIVGLARTTLVCLASCSDSFLSFPKISEKLIHRSFASCRPPVQWYQCILAWLVTLLVLPRISTLSKVILGTTQTLFPSCIHGPLATASGAWLSKPVTDSAKVLVTRTTRLFGIIQQKRTRESGKRGNRGRWKLWKRLRTRSLNVYLVDDPFIKICNQKGKQVIPHNKNATVLCKKYLFSNHIYKLFGFLCLIKN